MPIIFIITGGNRYRYLKIHEAIPNFLVIFMIAVVAAIPYFFCLKNSETLNLIRQRLVSIFLISPISDVDILLFSNLNAIFGKRSLIPCGVNGGYIIFPISAYVF